MGNMIFFMFLFPNIVISICLAVIGSSREIGAVKSFILSIFLTPFTGILFVFNSPTTYTIAYRKRQIDNQNEIIELLKKLDK